MSRSSLVGVAALMAVVFAAPVYAQDETAPAVAEAKEEASALPSNESVKVQLDLATVLRIPEGTYTLAIGNPAIADVTKPQSGGFTVVTGKSYGTTNLLALDSNGEKLKEMMIYVSAPAERTVIVQRGLARETWSCSPRCEPTATLGDAADYFGASSGQVGSRNGMATQR
ncbi:pilus assembly protein N-terminal domain-containing protein [Terrihabitans soli]|nr:pilus assembly protein N-terminal domain-containing protein [Terrihabitans soli]